ncbi:MAG TPA: insulinase family protein, partial [Panacibacter sp.]|nr:insulinase family protein [Panacibacter sp.]
RMFRKIFPVEYAGSKYAERLPIGKDSIIKNAKYDVIKRFYKEWYRPNLMAVIVVGDIDPAKIEKLIIEYFGGLKNPANPRLRPAVKVPARQKPEAVATTDKEATNFYVQIEYPFMPSKPDVTVADYRQSLVKGLFTSLLNQRFRELTQSANPPFLFAQASFSGYGRGYESFSGFAVAGKNGPDSALLAMTKEIERARKFGFSDAEMERAKKQMLAGFEQLYNNRDKTESENFAGEYIRNFTEQEAMPGIAKEYEYYTQMVPGIKLQEVNAIAEPLKKNENIFVSLQVPSSGDYVLPDNKTLLANALLAMKADVAQREEKAIAGELIKIKPQPGTIVSEQKNDVLAVTELNFANGVKIILKPTDFKNDEIIMSSFHKGGSSLYPAADKYSAAYASAIVQQMGIGDFSPSDLAKFMAGKTASAFPRIGGLSAGISGTSSVKDFETMLQLAYLYINSPRKDEALFNAWKEKQKSATQFAMANPQTAFIDTLYKTLYQKNPLAPSGISKPEDFDNIDFERALAVYKEQFGDAHDFTFIFTGSIDVEKIKPLLAIYLGSLPSTGKPAAFIDNGVRPVKGKVELNVHKGTEPKSLILTFYNGEIPYSEDLELKAQALSDILNIKIIEDLREKLGAIYGGGIFTDVSKYPYNNYSVVLQLPCGPENVDTLIKSANIEIEKIKTNGPTAEDLAKVKKTWIEQYKVQIKENGYWSGKLQDIYFSGNTPKRIFDYEKLVNALTIDDIKTVANQLLNGNDVLQAVLYPEK